MAFYLITSASTFPYFQIDRFTNQCRLQTNRNKEHILKIFLSVAFVIMTTGCIKNCKPLKSDPVYTVPDPQGHDIKLNTFKMSVALKFMIVLQKLTITNQRKSGEGIYVRKLTKLGVVTARIRYRVNGVSVARFFPFFPQNY